MTFAFSDEEQILTVYHYKPDTGVFDHTEENVKISPNGGLPAHCTIDEPPTVSDGHSACFDESIPGWLTSEDHIGDTAHPKNPDTHSSYIISVLGAIPDTHTLVEPGEHDTWDDDADTWVVDPARTAADLLSAQNSRISYMTLQCAAEVTGGISSSALGTVHNYDTRQPDQLNWEHALSQAITNTNPDSGQPGHDPELPDSTRGWITCNDPGGSLGYIKRGHTELQIHKVRSDFLVHKYTKSTKLQSKISAINSASTVTAVNSINW